jgi:hypothetical protein
VDTATRAIPEGLAQVAPGLGLAVLLAGLDVAAVSDDEVVEVLAARARQAAYGRARFLAAVVETALRSSAASGGAAGELGRYAPEEVRAALMLTSGGADHLLGEAWEVVERLPRLYEGMLGGELDESRARVFTRWTMDLPDDLARRVCDKLVPGAARWTTGQLSERIKRMILALDPDWARRRYEAALEGRDVVGYRDPEGTASLTGRQLPVDRVARACDRLDRLAKSAKSDGDPRRIGHLRAELFLGMTDGTYLGLSDAEILADLAATRRGPDDPGPDDPGPDPGPDDPGPDDPGPDDPGPGDDVPVRVPAPVPARGGIELQVRLSTLLGLDEASAEVAGWGPVHAALARSIAACLGDAQWRWAITGPEGYLCAGGITAFRPAGTTMKSPRTDDVLELAIPATLLDQLTELTDHQVDQNLAAWIPVLADIRRRLEFRTDKPPPDPGRRFPTAALRREIQMALRRCVGIGCRRPARKTDLDHTVDHAHGGPTTEENIGPACGRDHSLKHDGGWGLARTGPHTFTWTSPLGRRYVVHTPPVIEAFPAPEPSGTDPPPPWFRTDTRTPWPLTTTWDTPLGPKLPESEPESEREPRSSVPDMPPF